jgi:hypothetical protein
MDLDIVQLAPTRIGEVDTHRDEEGVLALLHLRAHTHA